MSFGRTAILKAAQSPWLRERAPRFGFVRRTVSRFMPGEDAADALCAARELAEKGIATVLTHLGENITDRTEAEQVKQHYIDLTQRIFAAQLPTEISIKLTQVGLDLDPEFCYANVAAIIERTPPDKTVWIDMEQSPYVDATLAIFKRARAAYANVGICVQAYLYRTEQDLDSLIALRAAIRLVKGAYNEPAELAFPKRKDVDENYFHLAQRLLSPESRKLGIRAAIATHDRELVGRLNEWAAAQGVPKTGIEYQMLYGIQRAEQQRLATDGYRSTVLVAYGTFWFPWFMRRLAERPANVLFLARNFFAD
jgi:proline dehydrogenase